MALALAIMQLYSIFNLRLFLSILYIYIYIIFNLVLKRQTEPSMVPASPNFICHFYESNTEGANFRIVFISFMFVKCACFISYSTSVRFYFCEKP